MRYCVYDFLFYVHDNCDFFLGKCKDMLSEYCEVLYVSPIHSKRGCQHYHILVGFSLSKSFNLIRAIAEECNCVFGGHVICYDEYIKYLIKDFQ